MDAFGEARGLPAWARPGNPAGWSLASSYGFVERPAREGVRGLLLRLVELVGRAGGTGLGLRVGTVLKSSMEAKDGWSGPCEGFGP